jgi:hypothetical protein
MAGSSTARTRARTRAQRTAKPRQAAISRRKRAGSAQRAGAFAGAARVRWDRVGRAAMLCVLGALVYLYLSAGLNMLSTLHQSHRDSATVSSMESEHRSLLVQHERLAKQGTLEAEARQLGMMKKGEQPYVVANLPNN